MRRAAGSIQCGGRTDGGLKKIVGAREETHNACLLACGHYAMP